MQAVIERSSTRAVSAAGLWDEFRTTACPEAREALVQQYLSLVHFVARRMSTRIASVEYDELVSAGNIGLLSAVEAYDPSRGSAFSTYAVPRIRGAILDELRRSDWLPRSSRARARRLLRRAPSSGRGSSVRPSPLKSPRHWASISRHTGAGAMSSTRRDAAGRTWNLPGQSGSAEAWQRRRE